jgi:hypothetical protein
LAIVVVIIIIIIIHRTIIRRVLRLSQRGGQKFRNMVLCQLKEMGRACSTNGGRRDAYRVLVAKPEGRRPLEIPWHSW